MKKEAINKDYMARSKFTREGIGAVLLTEYVDPNYREEFTELSDAKSVLADLIAFSYIVEMDLVEVEQMEKPSWMGFDECLMDHVEYYLDAFEALPVRRKALEMITLWLNTLTTLYDEDSGKH